MLRPLISILFLTMTLTLHAQYESDSISSSWFIGIAAGYYIPDDNSALYYAATDDNRLQSILNLRQSEVRDAVGGYDFTLEGLPTDLAYNSAFSFGVSIGYAFNEHWRGYLRITQVNLDASGVFTLNVQRTNPDNNTFDPFLERSFVYGRERRSHLLLAAERLLYFNDRLYNRFAVGFDVNNLDVQYNRADIADLSLELPIQANFQPTAPNANQGDWNNISTGFFLGYGLGYRLSSTYYFSANLSYLRSGIKVNSQEQVSSSMLITEIEIQYHF